MINFDLDSEEKKINVTLMLKGEIEPIKFSVGKYELFKEADKLFIEVSEIHTNREWMNTAIGNYLPKKKIEIPMEYEKLLQIAM